MLTGCMEHWPALARWGGDWGHLRRVAGPRTVPVEVGALGSRASRRRSLRPRAARLSPTSFEDAYKSSRQKPPTACRTQVGSHYLADKWRQELMTLDEFIDRFLLPGQEQGTQERGYLAQHQLFEQASRAICSPCCVCFFSSDRVDLSAWKRGHRLSVLL